MVLLPRPAGKHWWCRWWRWCRWWWRRRRWVRCIVDRRWLGAALILKLKIPTVGHQAPKWRVVFIMIIVMVVMVIIHLSNARPIVCQMSLSVNSDNYDHGVVMMRRVVVTISPIVWKTNYDHLGHFHQSSNWIQTFIVILFSGTMAFHKRLKSFRLNHHHSDGHLHRMLPSHYIVWTPRHANPKQKLIAVMGLPFQFFFLLKVIFSQLWWTANYFG